ncbi:unnamed protein product, partial [Staurois parvus]
MLARSCDQLCPITADHIGDTYTDHQGTDDQPQQCHLSASISASCQCSSMPPASAHQSHIYATYQFLPVHINATYQCPSELPFSITDQCHLSMPVSATYQCHQSEPVSVHISASQCHLTVPVSAAYQCHLSVPPISA